MTKQQLIDSLTAVQPTDAVSFDGDTYLDWSTRNEDGSRSFEAVDADGNIAQLRLTRGDLVRLHAALTLTLLADAES